LFPEISFTRRRKLLFEYFMKRILPIAFLAFFAFSCSTDTEEIEAYTARAQRQMQEQQIAGGSQIRPAGPETPCFRTLSGSASLNTTNGPGTGTLTFTAQPPANAPQGEFIVKVEIEEISDCEDLTSGNGNVAVFTNNTVYTNIATNLPKVTGVNPAETFGCYRWRIVLQSIRTGTINCTNYTPWYDAPLF
jgi:hypothetical protein